MRQRVQERRPNEGVSVQVVLWHVFVPGNDQNVTFRVLMYSNKTREVTTDTTDTTDPTWLHHNNLNAFWILFQMLSSLFVCQSRFFCCCANIHLFLCLMGPILSGDIDKMLLSQPNFSSHIWQHFEYITTTIL